MAVKKLVAGEMHVKYWLEVLLSVDKSRHLYRSIFSIPINSELTKRKVYVAMAAKLKVKLNSNSIGNPERFKDPGDNSSQVNSSSLSASLWFGHDFEFYLKCYEFVYRLYSFWERDSIAARRCCSQASLLS